MVNVYTYIRGNKTSTKYWMKSTRPEDYTDVSLDDAYDGEDADEYILELLFESNDNN